MKRLEGLRVLSWNPSKKLAPKEPKQASPAPAPVESFAPTPKPVSHSQQLQPMQHMQPAEGELQPTKSVNGGEISSDEDDTGSDDSSELFVKPPKYKARRPDATRKRDTGCDLARCKDQLCNGSAAKHRDRLLYEMSHASNEREKNRLSILHYFFDRIVQYKLRFAKHKTRAEIRDAALKATERDQTIIMSYRNKVLDEEDKNKDVKGELKDARKELRELRAQNKALKERVERREGDKR